MDLLPQPRNPCWLNMSLNLFQHFHFWTNRCERLDDVDLPPIWPCTWYSPHGRHVEQLIKQLQYAEGDWEEIRLDAGAKSFRVPPPAAQWDADVQFTDDLHDRASFFRKATCRLKILMMLRQTPYYPWQIYSIWATAKNYLSKISYRTHGRSLLGVLDHQLRTGNG